MPKFIDPTDPANAPKSYTVPEGEYIFTCVGMDSKISGGKYAGCDMYVMNLKVEDTDITVKKFLIDHPDRHRDWGWFVKSINADIGRNGEFHFVKTIAEDAGAKWVNPLGLRGRFKLRIKTTDRGGQFNEIESFVLGDPLPPVEVDEDDVPF